MIDSDNEDQKNKPTMSGSFENLERILQASGSIDVRVRNRIGRDDLYFLATLAAEKNHESSFAISTTLPLAL